jgi:hypothetical protein
MYKGYDFDHRPWFLISVSPEVEASVRRSTTVGVWILFLVMLGLLCVVLTPQSGHAKAAVARHPSAAVTMRTDHYPLLQAQWY